MVPLLMAPLVAEAVRRRVAAETLLRALGIGADELERTEGRLPLGRVLDAWELAMRAVRDPALPIAVGAYASVERFGVLGYALYTSPTAGAALAALARYHDLINDTGRWHVEPSPDLCVVRWEREGERLLGMRVANEQVLASFIALADRLTVRPVEVREVWFRHPAPARTQAHEKHFRGPIRWEAPSDAILLAPEFLGEPPRGFDPIMAQFFDAHIDAMKRCAGPPDSVRHQVADVVAAELSNGIPTIVEVAKKLDVSERTLRRRLREEGGSFDAIVVELQRSRAEALLSQGLPLRDVAFAVGFSDASAFSRAFRRWTGTAPSKWTG